jgi:hypothetical protein
MRTGTTMPMFLEMCPINIDGSVSGGVKGLGKRCALLYFIVYNICYGRI